MSRSVLRAAIALAPALLLVALATLRRTPTAHAFVPPQVQWDVGYVRTPGDLTVLATDPVIGPPTAWITIVEFSDFQCPYCARAVPTIEELRKRYGDKLRIVWKDLPLSFHYMARPAAKHARVLFLAKGNAAFWEFHATLYANQAQLASNLPFLAQAAGIDANLTAKLGERADALIDESLLLAKELGTYGTPAFYVDGELLNGAQPVDVFEKKIEAHLIEVKQLLAAGVHEKNVYRTMLQRHAPKVLTVPTP